MGCKCPCEFAQTLKIKTLFWLIFQIMHFSTVVAVKLQKALKKRSHLGRALLIQCRLVNES